MTTQHNMPPMPKTWQERYDQDWANRLDREGQMHLRIVAQEGEINDLRAHAAALEAELAHERATTEKLRDALASSLAEALAAARQPVKAELVAWMHTLDNTEGIAENEPTVVFSRSAKNPFGKPGRDYSASYPVTSVPLYLAAQQPATVGRDAVLEEAARICDAIESDKWALYKGREPYKGNEPGRADPHVQGESDGAGQCASRIRAALSQQERKEGGGA